MHTRMTKPHLRNLKQIIFNPYIHRQISPQTIITYTIKLLVLVDYEFIYDFLLTSLQGFPYLCDDLHWNFLTLREMFTVQFMVYEISPEDAEREEKRRKNKIIMWKQLRCLEN